MRVSHKKIRFNLPWAEIIIGGHTLRSPVHMKSARKRTESRGISSKPSSGHRPTHLNAEPGRTVLCKPQETQPPCG